MENKSVSSLENKNLKLAIEVKQMLNGDFLATVDWSKHDAGKVGTPGAVKYADTPEEAFQALKDLLISKGHMIDTEYKIVRIEGVSSPDKPKNLVPVKSIEIPELNEMLSSPDKKVEPEWVVTEKALPLLIDQLDKATGNKTTPEQKESIIKSITGDKVDALTLQEADEINNRLWEAPKPTIDPSEIHNKIMVQWEKDYGSIHNEQMMDAYTVSGFIKQALSIK